MLETQISKTSPLAKKATAHLRIINGYALSRYSIRLKPESANTIMQTQTECNRILADCTKASPRINLTIKSESNATDTD